MAKRNERPVFYCKNCGTPWSELYLAILCQKVDEENLTKVKGETKNAKDKASYRKK